jgi:hypothetical protein
MVSHCFRHQCVWMWDAGQYGSILLQWGRCGTHDGRTYSKKNGTKVPLTGKKQKIKWFYVCMYGILLPYTGFEWLALLLHIREGFGSSLNTDLLHQLSFIMAFCPYRQMSWQYKHHKYGYYCFLPHPFQFSNHSTIWCYIIWSTESITK